MHRLSRHKLATDPRPELLEIYPSGQPGPGGAYNAYRLSSKEGNYDAFHCVLEFKTVESGHKGVTHEALLAVIEDRLEAFQAGPFACAENATALAHVTAALDALKSRTNRRLCEGVEGTMQPDKAPAVETPATAPPEAVPTAEAPPVSDPATASGEPASAPAAEAKPAPAATPARRRATTTAPESKPAG